MNLNKLFLLVLMLAVFTHTAFSKGNRSEDNFTGLGFEFGIDKKEAIKLIKSEDRKVIEDTVDSKKIRTIIAEGAFIDLPVDTADTDLKTRLEFYEDKLMSSSLIFKSGSGSEQSEIESRLSDFLSDLYGGPGRVDKVLYFTTRTWESPDLVVVLSSDPKNERVKLQQIYEPINRVKIEQEYDFKRNPPSDPAKEIFLGEGRERLPQYR